MSNTVAIQLSWISTKRSHWSLDHFMRQNCQEHIILGGSNHACKQCVSQLAKLMSLTSKYFFDLIRSFHPWPLSTAGTSSPEFVDSWLSGEGTDWKLHFVSSRYGKCEPRWWPDRASAWHCTRSSMLPFFQCDVSSGVSFTSRDHLMAYDSQGLIAVVARGTSSCAWGVTTDSQRSREVQFWQPPLDVG